MILYMVLGTFKIMTDNIDDSLQSEISKICREYQRERVSGQWYITQTGLNKVCKILGGDYKTLTKKQNKILRGHCVDAAMGYPHMIKSWWYYLNCA